MRIIFAGTPSFAKQILQGLLAEETIDVLAVLTQPDRPKGRGKKISISPVKELALEHGIPVLQPLSLKDPAQETVLQLQQSEPDLMVVAAYGLLLPKHILELPRLGCINAHASLLPQWRGASPIQHSILSGDSHTGITMMQIEKGLDTGPALTQEAIEITQDDTSASLLVKLSNLAEKMTVSLLPKLMNNQINPSIQDDSKASYAHKITKLDAQINWNNASAKISRAIRAYNPAPVSYTTLGEHTIRVWKAAVEEDKSTVPPGTIVKIAKDGIRIATSDGTINLQILQFPGKKPVKCIDVHNAPPPYFIEGAHFD